MEGCAAPFFEQDSAPPPGHIAFLCDPASYRGDYDLMFRFQGWCLTRGVCWDERGVWCWGARVEEESGRCGGGREGKEERGHGVECGGAWEDDEELM